MVVLGSKSPRRKEILEMLGIEFEVYVSSVAEDIKDYKTPSEYVYKTALKKGNVVSKVYPNDTVICADTIVAVDDEILEKPKDKNDARRMCELISGRCHSVLTAVYISKDGKSETFVKETKVFISKMEKEEIEEYIKTSEPYDKAGGYAIQGIFAKFIDHIEGDYYNVMGLPLNEVYKKIKNNKVFPLCE